MPNTEDYSALFATYVVRNARLALSEVERAGADLPADAQDRALRALDFVLHLPEAWPLTRSLLLSMAPVMEQVGQRHEWMLLLARGVAHSQSVGDQETEAELRLHMGILRRLRGEFDLARSQLSLSIDLFETLNAPHRRARALIQLADVARLQDRFEEAAELAKRALAWLQDKEADLAYGYTVLGAIAFSRQDWPEAMVRFEAALDLWQKEGNQRMIAWSFTNLGATLWRMGEHEQALVWQERALALFEKLHDPIHQAVARMNLGITYEALGRSQEALACYKIAERIFRKAQDKRRLAIIHNNIGFSYRSLQQWPEAERAYRLSVAEWRQIGNVRSLANALDGLGLALLARGRCADAIAAFGEALRLLAGIDQDAAGEELAATVGEHLQKAIEDCKIGPEGDA